VNMRGKALLFKTISIRQKEIHRNFERVSSDLTIADAAAFLLRDSSPQHKLAEPGKVRFERG
jgi:hypothetical protein